jgi:CRISPR/Cas system-associated endonuclease Cas1
MNTNKPATVPLTAEQQLIQFQEREAAQELLEQKRQNQQAAIERQMNQNEETLALYYTRLNVAYGHFDRALVEMRHQIDEAKKYLEDGLKDGTIRQNGRLQS